MRAIVVGNSSNLLGKGLGRVIDEHDVVVRCNSFKIEGHEEDVGKKTNVWGLGTGGGAYVALMRFMGRYDVSLGFVPKLNHIWIPYSKVGNPNTFNMFLILLHSMGPQVVKKISTLQKRVERRAKKLVSSPSTGFASICRAIDEFGSVSVAGFGNVEGCGPSHYYDTDVVFSTRHKFCDEFSSILLLQEEGKVRIL